MKKIFVLVLALSLALTLCACSSSGKIPSLEEIVENGEAWSNEQLQQTQGCTLADLEKVWGKADGELPGEFAYFWRVDDTTSVNVYYHKNAEIEHITIIGPEEASGADDNSRLPQSPSPHRCLWHRWAAATLNCQERIQKQSCKFLTPAVGCPTRRTAPVIMC
ncbi:MAG: hypothetical protein HFF70_00400 [Oscillospiraceae bacterium]|nr:hypothetical protein [Oscillospiraceae bacterium]